MGSYKFTFESKMEIYCCDCHYGPENGQNFNGFVVNSPSKLLNMADQEWEIDYCKCPRKESGSTVNCLDKYTINLDVNNRDSSLINQHINIDFEDVLAEPRASQGLEPVWRMSFLLFSLSKLWTYRLGSALVFLPMSLFWGLMFSMVTVVYVWFIKPSLRLFQVSLDIVHQVWSSTLAATLVPVCQAFGLVFNRNSFPLPSQT